MKNLFFIAFLFISCFANAKLKEGTIFLNDGNVKIGYIKSFQEYNFLKDLKPFGSVVDKLNLDDQSVKYKRNLDDEKFETIATEDISRIVLVENNQTSVIYKPLRAGGVNSKGELEISDKKIWMPLAFDGKIEIYGFQLITNNQRTRNISVHYFYFLKYPEADYAISPLCQLGIFQLLNSEKLLQTSLEELRLLIPDCPKVLEPLAALNEKYKIKSERRAIKKELKKSRKENVAKFKLEYPEEGSIMINFVNVYNIYYEAIAAYNNNECN